MGQLLSNQLLGWLGKGDRLSSSCRVQSWELDGQMGPGNVMQELLGAPEGKGRPLSALLGKGAANEETTGQEEGHMQQAGLLSSEALKGGGGKEGKYPNRELDGLLSETRIATPCL